VNLSSVFGLIALRVNPRIPPEFAVRDLRNALRHELKARRCAFPVSTQAESGRRLPAERASELCNENGARETLPGSKSYSGLRREEAASRILRGVERSEHES